MRKVPIVWILAAAIAVCAGFAYDFRHQLVRGTTVDLVDEQDARDHFRATESNRLRTACETHPGMTSDACTRFAACVTDRMDGALSYDQIKKLAADVGAETPQSPYSDLRIVARDECRAIGAF